MWCRVLGECAVWLWVLTLTGAVVCLAAAAFWWLTFEIIKESR
jgi:hypothetical protein